MYNSLVRLRNNRENAFADIDVQLKQRLDLIPQLVESGKGYASHEKETLERDVYKRQHHGQCYRIPADYLHRITVHIPVCRLYRYL